MMHRRTFVAACGSALVLLLGRSVAQTPRVWRIGFLTAASGQPNSRGPADSFIKGMADAGHVEGKHFRIEYRSAEGDNARLPALAEDLVRQCVDVIVAVGALSAQPAQAATRTIPIVVWSNDFLGADLAPSLGRPGGNVTGVNAMGPVMSGKRLELLKEALPGIRRVAVLSEAGAPVPQVTLKELRTAAARLGLQVQSVEVRGPKPDIAGAFKSAVDGGARAMVVVSNPLTSAHRDQIADVAARSRMPAVYADNRFIEAGGLMSYGADPEAAFIRIAYYVDRIFRGAKPADLPVEQPTKFELFINAKAAKSIGLVIPPKLLARADRVIE